MQPRNELACRACGAANPAAFRFCGSCGAGLERSCPSCAASMPAAARFCGACGTDMEATVGAETRPATERKVVTVLFGDLATSTELATRLDPEDLQRVYSSYFEAMAAVIDAHGGVVEKFIGDAVVGVFGAPITHEDDPERAVRAGLAMQSALRDVNRELGSDLDRELALRVGIHTGEVITSPGATDQALVIGETTSIAARLQAVAPSGGVVVSERTRRGTRRSFASEGMGAFELKGVPGRTHVWLVTGEVAQPVRQSAEPLVGRVDEMSQLQRLLRRCERESGSHLATIVGPAGIGKSRLAFEFANASGATIMHGRCLPYGSGLRLWPLAEMLKADASILDSDPPDVILAKAQAEIGWRFGVDGPADTTLPTLLSSIGIPVDPDPLAGIGLDAGQRMIVDSWTRYFTTLATDGPVIAWIEDLHWADEALLDLLERLLSRVAAPILFLCPARPELLDRRPTWGGTASTSMVDLQALPSDETARIVRHLLDAAVDAELTSAIVERSGGNPFFATELIRTLQEDGAIARRDGVWFASRDVAAAMPDTVQMAIAARIDRLEPATKSILQLACVVGRTFWIGTWEALQGPGVDDAIETLTDRGLVRPRRASRVAGAREYTFEHALIREVAYGGLPKARRVEMHRAVLDWMERGTRGRDEEFAELLAYHAETAGDLERTARFATLAGHRHRRVYAAEEAIAWYGRAAAAIDGLAQEQHAGLRIEILHSRGEVAEQLGRYEDALRDYRAALAIAHAGGRAWWQAQELAAVAGALRSLERYAEAEEVIPEALAAAREVGWDHVEARTLCLAGQLARDRGDLPHAREQLGEGLRVSQEAHDLEGEAFARTGLAEVGLCQGPFDRAIADGARARHLWLRLGHRPAATSAAQTLGFLRALTGDLEGAERLFADALISSRELEMGLGSPLASVGLALVAMQEGALGHALSLLDEAIAGAEQTDAPRASVAARSCRLLLWQVLRANDRAAADLDRLDATSPFLAPVRLAAEGWQRVVDEPARARACFARARSRAEDLMLPRLACGRIEILAWDEAGDRAAMADAAAWLLEGVHGCPAAEALGSWALASVGAADPQEALALARRAGDRTLLWRACALAADDADGRGDAATVSELRTEARELVGTLAGSLVDEATRARFLSRGDIVSLLDETPHGLR